MLFCVCGFVCSSAQKTPDYSAWGLCPPTAQPCLHYLETSPELNRKTIICKTSGSGHFGTKKTPPRRVDDDDALKRTRLNNSQYELSQDLQDKQVEMLERKYGGVCARKAALTIQRAFRKHCMSKRFQQLTHPGKKECRTSRRFTNTKSEGKHWLSTSDHSSCSEAMDNGAFYGKDKDLENDLCMRHSLAYIDAVVKSNLSTLCRNLGEKSQIQNFYSSNRHLRLSDASPHRYVLDFPSCTTVSTSSTSFPEHVVPSCDMFNNVDDSVSEVNHLPATLDDNSIYHTPPMNVQPSSCIPYHSYRTAVQKSGGKRYIPSKSGPILFPNPSQSTPSSRISEQFYTPRQSLSSEENTISSSNTGDPSIDSLSEDSQQLNKASSARRSVNVSMGYTFQLTENQPHRTPGRTCDYVIERKCGQPYVDHRRVSSQESRKPTIVPNHEMKYLSKSTKWPNQTLGQKSRESNYSYEPHSVHNKAVGVDDKSRQTARKCSIEYSPTWNRKTLTMAEQVLLEGQVDDRRLGNISENSEDSLESASYSTSPPVSSSDAFSANNYPEWATAQETVSTSLLYKSQVSELQRKRQYRVGLNLFNKKPERGINYLIHSNFLESTPKAVARFLISRKGLSKQNIGEYLGNLQNNFNSTVLECFVEEVDLAGMQVDVALRKYQTFFRMPGEAQKIEKLVEVFSNRYIACNRDVVSKFQNPDTIFILAFAIIMLNTDLHTPNLKADKRMKLEDFIKNLRGIDDGHDLDRDMLVGIYERIKTSEFKPGSDHVTQVLKVQQTIVGKKPNLAQPHRRLVCYCRLYEVYDINKKERAGIHQREVFLFNDTLMVTKIFSKKKTSITYTFRQSFPLCGMSVTLFEAPYYMHGIRLAQRLNNKVLVTFNARNEHDRSKFVDDLKESILEMDEMENLRIETELEKQKSLRSRTVENRDSGVADIVIFPTNSQENIRLSPDRQSSNLKRSTLSNSLLDLHDQQMNKPIRRGSAGSLDSGMSVSFQSSSASTGSQDSQSQAVASNRTHVPLQQGTMGTPSERFVNQQGFLGGLFGKKIKTPIRRVVVRTADSTDV
ncbi:IQ motif and SEC7 domain-containing protein 1-like isoform X2 [Limulus polyphemus]|uniref:IQ motif and SEC7 domain-containing protein 1-like isoform X2 n=1 Tax=Limulus polyphemus TaxID=6850 RepID=A0ABM1BI75_LIMPO|nr:IQ motif and SEC7 domain-containing protein 1-like isoform X2 [Limulus polyphemus]